MKFLDHTNQIYIQQSYNDMHCMQNNSMHMYSEYNKPAKHHSQTQTVDYVPNACNLQTQQIYQEVPLNTFSNSIPSQSDNSKAMLVSNASGNQPGKREKMPGYSFFTFWKY